MKVAKKHSVTEHQSNQSAEGERFEEQTFTTVYRALNKANKLEQYELVRFGKYESIPVIIHPVYVSQFRLRSNRTVIKPDLAIKRLYNGRFLVFIGCKKSFRERHSLDDRFSLYARMSDDPRINGAMWIEAFYWENSSDGREQVIAKRDSCLEEDIAVDSIWSPLIDNSELGRLILKILGESA